MTTRRHDQRGLAIPDSRLSRLTGFGALTSGIAGDMALGALREVAGGRRPSFGDLLLTPANAARFADRLARMRGAAMKMGQLLSMEGGDLLPPELAETLGRLRSEAHFMPPRQLKTVLEANLGRDFLRRFESFSTRPIAAASIGQVHRARTRDGRHLALKVQYPGVRRSIDSDVENVAALIRVSGLVPRGLDLRPLLDEARRQLHEEADYAREGRFLARFHDLLAGDPDFAVPALHPDLSTGDVLAMSFMEGVPVEVLAGAPQAVRDRVVSLLIELVLRELFEFRLMQTDPNFANYRYEEASGRIVLLDFGATREIEAPVAEGYRRLLRAGIEGSRDRVLEIACELGLLPAELPLAERAVVERMLAIAFEPLRREGVFDFATADVAGRLRDEGMRLSGDREAWHLPPVEALFIQRKIGGTYLLAARLGARVRLRELLEGYL